MDEQKAKQAIESLGYEVNSLRLVPEGIKHYVFEFKSQNKLMFARFAKTDNLERDPVHGGALSLEREAYLCSLVRNKAGLPAPQTEGPFQFQDKRFLIAEAMPGIYWNKWLKNQNYSLNAYLRSLEFLGGSLAQAHKVVFSSFGNIMNEGVVEPEGIMNFADRLNQIIGFKIAKEEEKNILSKSERNRMKKYFARNLEGLSSGLKATPQKPSLLLTDIHPTNYSVDETGRPCGYFDLETCQAGLPPLEFLAQQVTMFNFFDSDNYEKARDAFFRGYEQNGGAYEKDSQVNKKLESLLYIGHALSCVTVYHGVRDGIRDEWSEQSKTMLFRAVEKEDIDYTKFSDMFRSKTKQPNKPNLS